MNYQTDSLQTNTFSLTVKKRSDRLMNYFLIAFFTAGLIFATFYDTWLIAFGVGGSCMAAYYLCKTGLPDSDFYQYILSIVLAVLWLNIFIKCTVCLKCISSLL